MIPRRLVILGSTGSIGRSTLDVVRRHPGRFDILALAGHRNAELLEQQYREFRPKYLAVAEAETASALRARFAGEKVEILDGPVQAVALAGHDDADLVLNAVVGSAGMLASLEAIKKGKLLALANKESLVAGGPLFAPLIAKSGAKILPVDSEHSAIWQALASGREHEIKEIILTGSGGPFRTLPVDQFENITVEQALKHPTWNMGPKITIDSATMVNKGLEVIEAIALFSVPASKIRVVVHPQSIVHSMVEFVDSSVIAQLSLPDMRLPISYALCWPDRVASEFGRIDWRCLPALTFEPPDYARFPLLKLAFEVATTGGTGPAVYNAANEEAVGKFLSGTIRFPRLVSVVQKVVEQSPVIPKPTLEEIQAADSAARHHANQLLET